MLDCHIYSCGDDEIIKCVWAGQFIGRNTYSNEQTKTMYSHYIRTNTDIQSQISAGRLALDHLHDRIAQLDVFLVFGRHTFQLRIFVRHLGLQLLQSGIFDGDRRATAQFFGGQLFGGSHQAGFAIGDTTLELGNALGERFVFLRQLFGVATQPLLVRFCLLALGLNLLLVVCMSGKTIGLFRAHDCMLSEDRSPNTHSESPFR